MKKEISAFFWFLGLELLVLAFANFGNLSAANAESGGKAGSAPPSVQTEDSHGFFVGAASESITPDVPTALGGQFHTRISKGVTTPLYVNAVAMEHVRKDGNRENVVLVSADVAVISEALKDSVYALLEKRLPNISQEKVILAATHVHSAPTVVLDEYVLPETGVMTIREYVDFAAERTVTAICRAWENRKPGTYAFGLGHAVVGANRRAIYANGTAVMYGKTNDPNFRAVEGMEDHDVNCMFFWNSSEAEKPIAAVVNLACPSQENEGSQYIDADFWAPARNLLKKELGKDLVVLGMAGAAGDMSPHIRYRAAAEERMQRLRKLRRSDELGRRIAKAVLDTYSVTASTREVPDVVKGLYAEIQLPERKVSKSDYENALANALRCEKAAAEAKDKGAGGAYAQGRWHRKIVTRWEKLQKDPTPHYPACLRVVRIGETVFCTNSFELYTDFGIQMKARSCAAQTFVVQLCAGIIGNGSYLPSKRAMEGGGYGAIVQSNIVGAEGGQVLVEKTLEMVDELFPKK